MFAKALYKHTEKVLAGLDLTKFPKNTYLAGGTGLAIQLGHRVSVDLDFFTPTKFEPYRLATQLKSFVNLKVEEIREGTIIGSINEIRFSLFNYEYPVLFPFKHFLGARIADYRDIAPMKITALTSRGKKRDFVDLYFICQKTSLRKILALYKRKYGAIANNLVPIQKSLVYFKDAESDPMPKMLKTVDWAEVKSFLITEVDKIWR